jgi:transposase InsO family protein
MAADFTYIWTAEGWLYVAVVLDLYARRIVGWSMQESMTSQLVADALMMAIWRRGRPQKLLHHSDQGIQYTSEHFQGLLRENGVTCSMSRAGEVWDNSAIESFFIQRGQHHFCFHHLSRQNPKSVCSSRVFAFVSCDFTGVPRRPWIRLTPVAAQVNSMNRSLPSGCPCAMAWRMSPIASSSSWLRNSAR